MRKKAIVVHSGGMDSSICLAQAIRDFSNEEVLSLSFTYNQRHQNELDCATKICRDWGVDHYVLPLNCLTEITDNALINSAIEINHEDGKPPNTLVTGRNGLMARLAAIHAESLGADIIYLGVIEIESANSGYRDCTRHYMDLMQEILSIDLDNTDFEIRTPVIFMTKAETMKYAFDMGVLPYLIENTITCYEGISGKGCERCPSCQLRNAGLVEFCRQYPEVQLSVS